MKKNYSLVVVLTVILQLIINTLFAQSCPSSITISSTNVTPATCPSNGSVVIHSNAESVPSAMYQIISGPAGGGWQTTSQSSNTFNSLPAGSYTIKVSCGSATNTVNVTVSNNYTAPTISVSVTNVCTNYTPGGTITVTGTGSSTPLKYGMFKSNDANAADANFAYQTTNIFNVTSFGTYQLRVKDACNNYVTQTVQVQPSLAKAYMGTWDYAYNSCNTLNVAFNLYKVADNTGIELSQSNYKLEIWESTSTSCPGSVPATAPTQTITLNSSNLNSNFNISKNTNSYYYRVTSACGDVTTDCITVPNHAIYATPYLEMGCGSGSTNAINFQTNAFPKYSLKIIGYNASNTQISNQTFGAQNSTLFTGLTVAHHYSYTFTDACGNNLTGTVSPPAANSATATIQSYGTWCTTVIGTGVLRLEYGGLIPGLASMTSSNVKLINSSTGATYNADNIQTNPQWVTFINVPPGTYKLRFTAPTGGCVTDITVQVNATSDSPVTFTLNGTATQLCGGTGSINAIVATNASAPVSFQLKNSSGAVISSNSSGNFTNLAPGTYTVVATLNGSCSSGQGDNITASKQFTIAPAGAGPIILKKVGIACDANPSSGLIALGLAGAGPFVLEMKKSAEVNYATVNAATPNDYTITGLTAGETYDLRIIDQCGNTSTTAVTLKPLTTVSKLTTMSPCIGQSYTLSVENLPGATYAWTYNGGGIISTSPDLSFSSYSATNDGTYVCTVNYQGCITRQVTYIINSTYCGSPLPVNFGDIEAMIKGGNLIINWSSMHELNNSMFEIEISADGTNFRRIGTVQTKSVNGISNTKLDYTFEMPLSDAATKVLGIGVLGLLATMNIKRKRVRMIFLGILTIMILGVACNKTKETINQNGSTYYIKIATVDIDGNKAYSKVIKIGEE